MQVRCPESKILCPAYLRDHQLVFRIHADIESKSNTEVHGILWETTEGDLEILDKFEGVPRYYIRHLVWVYPSSFENIPVNQITNHAVKAWVYEMVNKNFYDYPSERYWNICWDGYEANNINTLQLERAYSSISK